jgi:protein-disulfide isomerase
LAKLKDKWVIRWPKDAKITIVEFTELLCPYCQRQSQQWTITSAIQQFSGQVNSISRSFIIHGDAALQLSLAMECVADLKPWVYYDVLDGAFWAYPVDMTGIVNIAVENWVNKQSLQSCIEDWKYIQSIMDLMNLWAELWVNWTPWSLVINNESLKYELIAWAYPIETFVETIESLLN